jgi:hypothetical protein
MSHHTGRLLFMLIGLLVASSAGAQASGPNATAATAAPAAPAAPEPFQFSSDVRQSLQNLWRTSADARLEEVACLGGERRDGVSYITRIERVETRADSMNASAAISISECGAPRWLGTVHTHIAHFGGQPYVTFSAPDRGVMRAWHSRWKADGVFCVLYDPQHAYCEAGDESSGDTSYAEPAVGAPGR